jgi:hypothetical protein
LSFHEVMERKRPINTYMWLIYVHEQICSTNLNNGKLGHDSCVIGNFRFKKSPIFNLIDLRPSFRVILNLGVVFFSVKQIIIMIVYIILKNRKNKEGIVVGIQPNHSS